MPKRERVHVVIDTEAIATKDAFSIIEPVWFTANIYGSYGDYEQSLTTFSKGQRLLLGVYWYVAEVKNGGHDQFYFNSTGIVWEDAQKGFKEIGLPQLAEIVAESAKRMAGRPPFDREQRKRRLDELSPTFDDLDDRFYELEKDIDARAIEYIRAHPNEFFFDGDIEK